MNIVEGEIYMSKGSRCWKYRNEDLEKLLGYSRNKLWRLERSGKLDRGDIFSIINEYMKVRCGRCLKK